MKNSLYVITGISNGMNERMIKKKKLSDGIRKKDPEFFAHSGELPVRMARRQDIFDAEEPAEEEIMTTGMTGEYQDEISEEDEDAVFSRSPRDQFFARLRAAREQVRARRRIAAMRGSSASRLVRWGIAAGCAAIIAAAFVLSTAGAALNVSVRPRMESVSLRDIGVRFDAGAVKTDLRERTVPAERFEATRTVRKEFSAMGREEVRQRARGSVKIYNKFSSSPQVFVARTRFVTDAGALFILPRQIKIPGAAITEGKIAAQFIEAELVADQPGEQYNIAGEITLRIPGLKGNPKYDGFYAVSEHGFSGGVVGMASVASAEEIARAQEAVTKEASEILMSEMARQVPPGLVWRDQLREVEITRVDAPRPGTAGEKFFVEAAAVGRALAFRESDVNTLIKDAVVGDDKSRALVDGSAKVEYAVRSIDFDLGRADVLIRGTVKTTAVIPESELAALIAGKKEGSIGDVLKNRQDIAGFTLSFFPPWRSSAPKNLGKIRFVVE